MSQCGNLLDAASMSIGQAPCVPLFETPTLELERAEHETVATLLPLRFRGQACVAVALSSGRCILLQVSAGPGLPSCSMRC